MTARSRERGSHAGRSRGYALPFPDHQHLGSQVPVRPGADPTDDGLPASPLPRGGASRHRKASEPKTQPSGPHEPAGPRSRPRFSRSKLPRQLKLAGVLAVVAALVAVGFVSGFGDEESAEPTVQAFLLDWQQGHYAQAAALTNGGHHRVATQLAAAYRDLDATNAFLALSAVHQHGNTATAQFRATVDLAQPGQQWAYTGQFTLTSTGGRWTVNWGPSVINPSLATGDRLAVVTAFPPRAPVENASGESLLTQSAGYHVGVYPGRLQNAARTATAFSEITGLNQQQVLGQIHAAPPRTFLSLLTLAPHAFRALWPKVAKVAGVSYQRRTERLFDSNVPEAVGQVGTEDADELRAEGARYQPGTTVGLTGLEQAFSDELTGTPTTSVVVVNSSGRTTATLLSSPGQAGTPVHTTLSGPDQAAALAALAARGGSGEVVAVDTQTGAIRALASRTAGSAALPSGGALNGQVAPGMAFSIVSAAALLSAGVPADQPAACEPATGAGVTFAYQPGKSARATFASDFAAGCGTALANMSQSLSPARLTTVERAFGIGGAWHLRVPAFSGLVTATSDAAATAAEATGQRGVLVSPLSMAMVAAEVASGVGHSPFLVADEQSAGQAADPTASWPVPLSPTALSALRGLMRLAVAKGSAHAASLSGAPVYGQAGVVKTGQDAYVSWFVGYRGTLAVATIETGTTASQAAAAALAGTFLKTAS